MDKSKTTTAKANIAKQKKAAINDGSLVSKSSKSKANGFAGWFKSHKPFTIVLSLALAVFIGIVVFTMVYYHDKAAPGTTIANAKVGGQTKSQLITTINGLVNNMKLSLNYNGKSATASASDLGINIDTNKIATAAVKTGQRDPFSTLALKQHFDLTGSYDKAKVQAFVKANFPELTTDPIDAQIIYDADSNRYVVQPGAIGRSVKLDELYKKVESMLSSPKITNYQIATNDSAPTVSNEAAEQVASQVNQAVASNIKIINNGRVLWTIDPWTIAEWTTFKVNPSTHSYDVAYDKSKIQKFVDTSVVGQISNKPINQKAITNGNGEVLQVISPGQNGQQAENTSAVADEIYTKLLSGQGGNVNLATKDAAFQTDATVASDGHWIEANLSTFQVILHDGTNVVWSTDQTSQGKPSTGTITGLYTVWRKVPEQCMPNPPSSQPLCGIHWVTYWERSGYAFHEAWWLDYSKGNVRSYISHGCINMFTADAKRVYDFSSIGTPVWVHR